MFWWRLLVSGGGLGGFGCAWVAVVGRVRGTAEPCPRGPRHRFAVTSPLRVRCPNLRLGRGAFGTSPWGGAERKRGGEVKTELPAYTSQSPSSPAPLKGSQIRR